MWVIDRYIARRFLINFLTLLILLFVFVVSIDLVLALHRFTDVASQRVDPHGGVIARTLALTGVVLDFHAPRIFQFYAYMVGMLSVGAMGFTLAHMHRHRELVAIVACGIPLRRLAAPIIVSAIGLNVLQLLNQELVLPRLAPLLIRSHGDIGRQNIQTFDVPLTADGRGSLIQASSFDFQTGTLTLPTIIERDEGGHTIRRITAEEARWNKDHRRWELVGGRAIIIPPLEPAEQTATMEGQPIELYETDVTPEVLTMRHAGEFSTMLSLKQIRRMLATPGVVDTDALVRLACARFTTVLVNILVLLMTLPYFLLREPASLLRKSFWCAATAIPTMMGALLAAVIDLPGIPPVVEVLVPVGVLIPVAIFMMTSVRT